MKNLAYTKAEIKKRNSPGKAECAPSMEGEKYPWGLSIDLREETLNKLDLDSLPKVGKVMTMTARVRITGARSEERSGGKRDRSISLQIEAMDLEPGSPTSAVDAVNEALSGDDE